MGSPRRPDPRGGTTDFVAEAVTADDIPAVIKVAMPAAMDGRAALENEVRTLRLANGRGCVRVLDYDADRGAVLLERLGPQLQRLNLPVAAQMEVICSLLGDLWTVPCGEADLPSLHVKGRWLAEFITATWEHADRPCSRPVIDRALTFAERRSAAFDPSRAVLAHGDGHASNTLQDLTSMRANEFKLIDPDGLRGEPEYDLAILMREFTDEPLAGDPLKIGLYRAGYVERHTGYDEQKIWEWGYVERVSAGLLCAKLGHIHLARDFLHISELWSVVT
jgi:streptomycin 6-kinase